VAEQIILNPRLLGFATLRTYWEKEKALGRDFLTSISNMLEHGFSSFDADDVHSGMLNMVVNLYEQKTTALVKLGWASISANVKLAYSAGACSSYSPQSYPYRDQETAEQLFKGSLGSAVFPAVEDVMSSIHQSVQTYEANGEELRRRLGYYFSAAAPQAHHLAEGQYYKKLELGRSIPRGNNWTILDHAWQVNMDENTLKRIPDNTIELYFSSHFIEHIHPTTCLGLMKEIYRTLEPGGLVRITGPCMEKFTDVLFYDEQAAMEWWDVVWPARPEGVDSKELYLNMLGNPDGFGEEGSFIDHKWMVSASMMTWFLCAARFSPSKIYKCRYQGSRSEELRQDDFDNRALISFYIEAQK